MGESGSGSAWSVAFRQWRGERPYQEDDFGIVGGNFGGEEAVPELLMVLADGMGGEVGGATASRSVVRTFLGRFGETEGAATARLNECLDAANRFLYDQVSDNPELDGMGSTVVAAVYDGRSVAWLSVGDSPMWLYTEGRLTRLNADHSMAPVLDRMVGIGELSREEALSDGTRHMLRSAVTGLDVDLVDCARRPCRLEQGDCLLVASDGIETLAEEEIERCLRATNGDAEASADALFSAVQSAGRSNQDNVTFLLLAGRDHTTPRPESDRTVSALVPVPALPAPKLKSKSPIFPRRGVAVLLVAAGLVLGVGLLSWGPGDPSAPEPTPAPSPEPAAVVREPVADDSQAPPATAGAVEETTAAETAEPAARSPIQNPETVDTPTPDAPGPSPAASAESTTETQPAASAESTTETQPAAPAERKGPISEETPDTAVIESAEPEAHSGQPVREFPGPTARDVPPAPVDSAAEPQYAVPAEAGAAEAADTPESSVAGPPGPPQPAGHSEPRVSEASGAAARDATTPPATSTNGPTKPTEPIKPAERQTVQ